MDDTREERANRVIQAIANERLSGLEVSEFTKATAQRYVEGEISLDELADLVRKHHGIPIPPPFSGNNPDVRTMPQSNENR
jgi:hypothetical protein